MLNIDPNTDRGKHILNKLNNEQIIWITTVSADGVPHPSPVWFWWDGEAFLIYSRANKPKVHNIEIHPTVALHFNSDFKGHDVVIFQGTAVTDATIPPANEHPGYLEKYRHGIASINMTPESFAQGFSTPIQITPTKMR